MNEQLKKKVLIIDDSEISQHYLSNIFKNEGWVVIGSFSSISSAEDTILNEKPDLISLDFNLGNHNAIVQLRRSQNLLKFSDILFITEDQDIKNLIIMYETSARGIASKKNIPNLSKIIRATSKGLRCYDEEVSNKLLQYHLDSKSLSFQEKRTFVGLMSGDTISKVAESLNLGDRTVWKHRRKIIAKISLKVFEKYCACDA